MSRKRPSVHDIARECHVSIATVSRVLNGKEVVRSETCDRVISAAVKLGYPLPRHLRPRQYSPLVLIMLPSFAGEFFSNLMAEFDRQTRQTGIATVLVSTQSRPRVIRETIQRFREQIDGIFFLDPKCQEKVADELVLPDVLTVFINGHPVPEGCPRIEVANYEGAAAMTRHLVNLYGEAIAIISGPHKNYENEERLRGVIETYRALTGKDLPPEQIFQGGFTYQSGKIAAAQILSQAKHPRAIFALNDTMALGALEICQTYDLNVPDDIAVTGFDDIPVAAITNPPLTTIHIPCEEIVRNCLFCFEQWRQGESYPPAQTVATGLIIRESCGHRRRQH